MCERTEVECRETSAVSQEWRGELCQVRHQGEGCKTATPRQEVPGKLRDLGKCAEIERLQTTTIP